MLVWLINWLADATAEGGAMTVASAVRSPVLRAAIAAAVCLLLTLALGPRSIAWLRARFLEPDKCPSPAIRALHQSKRRTPTMGGIFLIAGLAAAVLLLADLRNPLVLLALALTAALAALGAIDDLVKLRTSAAGISPRAKLLAQTAIAALAALALYRWRGDSSDGAEWLSVVGLAPATWRYVPFAALVIVSSSNAVNLTDGLDGLAGGTLLFSVAALAVLLFIGAADTTAMPVGTQQHLSSELLVIAGAMAGGILGFLRFNLHPAQVFMGNTGSLALGGLLALLALAAHCELLLVVIGGVFVVEAASVLVQVGVYKLRGRRLLRCAPLHHHFELVGWPETTIVVRFWIASGVCAVVGVLVGLL